MPTDRLLTKYLPLMLLLIGIACSAPNKSSLEKRKKIQEQRKQKGGCPNLDCT